MVRDKEIHIKKCLCGYCGHIWIRVKDGVPKGCPDCHRRFVGKKVIILKEVTI